MYKGFLVIFLSVFMINTVNAADIVLPKPYKAGGMPLVEAINERRSNRSFDVKMLDSQILSNLLWVTWGISSSKGYRVIPTARNKQDMDLYVLMSSGAYVYDAKANKLKQVSDKDLREFMIKGQEFVRNAPIHLLFVTKDKYYGAFHAGAMSQNASLYCTSARLSCVVRGMFDKENIEKELGLKDGESVIVSEAIGYFENKE